MRIKHSLIIGTFLLFVTSIVGAVTYGPTRAAGGVQTLPSSSWGGPDGSSGIYERGDAGITYHKANNTEVVLGAGGGGGSGTVTSIACGSGMSCSPSTITGTGSVSLNLGNANTWTAAQDVDAVALTDGVTISTNAALGNSFYVTLGGNRTIANPTNLVNGATKQWELIQDGTGSRTVTWDTDFTWPGGGAPTLQTAPGARDLISCYYDGTSLLCVSIASGGSGGTIGGSIASGQIAIGATTSNQIQGSSSLTYASNAIIGDPTGGLTIQDSTSNNSSLRCSSTAATLTGGTGTSKVQASANSSDTSVDYSLGGTLLASLALGTIVSGSVAFVASSSATYLGFFDSSFNGFKVQGGIVYIRTSGADLIEIVGSVMQPFNDAGFSIGADAHGIRSVTLSPITAPGAPSGTGQMRLYVDTADNKLKAIASSGTVTVVASP